MSGIPKMIKLGPREILDSGALHAAPCGRLVSSNRHERRALSEDGRARACSRDGCTDTRDLDVIGSIAVLELDYGLSMEVMDYTFSQPTLIPYGGQSPFIEFLQLESVCAVVQQEGHSYPVKPGMYVSYCPGDEGCLVFSAGIPVRGLRIRFSLDAYDERIAQRFPDEAPGHARLRGYNNQPLDDSTARFVFKQIKAGVTSGVSSALYYESKLMELIHIISERMGQSRCQGQSGTNRLSRQDAEALEEVRLTLLAGPPTPKVKELALAANMSLSKLHRDFKLAYGHTVHGYLHSARMSKALEMVTMTDEPLYLIAANLGYKKAGNFSKAYRQSFGISPREHRRRG